MGQKLTRYLGKVLIFNRLKFIKIMLWLKHLQ